MPASPTKVRYCPADEGGVLVRPPADDADKKYISPGSNDVDTATCPVTITRTSFPAVTVVSAIPATTALSKVSLAIAFPT